jgi:hypothetical protein
MSEEHKLERLREDSNYNTSRIVSELSMIKITLWVLAGLLLGGAWFR